MDNLAVSISKIQIQQKIQQKIEIQQKIQPKETKQQIAFRLLRTNLDKNGLTDWHIRLSKAVKRLGSCNYPKKTISLSSLFIETGTETTILNTILHEIAHALCPGDGHGPKWKKKAIELGCDGKRCADGIKLNLKYNFECEKGCRASYTKKCKVVDFLLTGKAKCKKHGVLFYSIEDKEQEDEQEDDKDSDIIEQKAS
jgi:hypothetical protein